MRKNVTVERFKASKLTFTFLTGHPTDQLPSRNIVPYYELPIYRTPGPEDLPARSLVINKAGQFTVPVSKTVRSSNIQLNMIPDKLFLFLQKVKYGLHICRCFLNNYKCKH